MDSEFTDRESQTYYYLQDRMDVKEDEYFQMRDRQ